MKIDHYAIEVSDLESAIRFYVENLGFRLKSTALDENVHEAFAFLEAEGGNLELIQALSKDNRPQSFQPQAVRPHLCPHLALQSEDLDRTLAMIRERGLNLAAGPLEAPGHARWLYICDPDQNVIEFFQDLTAR